METADVETAARVMTEVIRVEGLTFTYPKGTVPAVRGMDFTVGRGEIFGFLGPSGAGKSTTTRQATSSHPSAPERAARCGSLIRFKSSSCLCSTIGSRRCSCWN
jgi:ABC-type glutathione transport system ATPase component